MARISGVDLPRNKRIDVGLTYVFGIGRASAKQIIVDAKIAPSTRCGNLTDQEINAYVDEDRPFSSCGSYMFEKIGYKLFKETNGSLEAINGLPFNLLKETINEHL